MKKLHKCYQIIDIVTYKFAFMTKNFVLFRNTLSLIKPVYWDNFNNYLKINNEN